MLNPLSTNSTKWPNILDLSVFDHFVGLALKELTHFRSLVTFYKTRNKSFSNVFRGYRKRKVAKIGLILKKRMTGDSILFIYYKA